MIRIFLAIALVLLTTDLSLAQSYCEQVRQAIAQYGYASAKRYAVEHYSPEEVRAADRCAARLRGGGYRHRHYRRDYR